jgi:excisionase family DNA binding protein
VITQATNTISDSMETPVALERAGIRLLTPDDVASMFSVDRRTVLKWARDKKLERVKTSGKVIRFTPESIDLFVKSKIQGVESATTPRPKPRAGSEKSIAKKGGVSQSSRKSSWRSRREATKWL